MTNITFLVATQAEPREVTGKVAMLLVGKKRHRFVIHEGMLSDYRSGRSVGSLQAIKVERMARISHYTRTTDRQAAEILLERIVANHGLPKVVAILAAAPTLNGAA